MKKFLNKKVLVFATLLLIAVSATAVAQTVNRDVTATMRYDMNVRLDGELLTLRDANGNVIQPMSFDGTTYLPLRAIAEILGIDVDWDADTQTALLYSRRERQLWLADNAQIETQANVAHNRASIVRGAANMPQQAGHEFNSAVVKNMSTLAATGTIQINNIFTSLSFESVFFETERTNNLNFTIVNADTGTTLHQMTLTPNTFYDNVSFYLYGATRIRIESPIDGSRGSNNTLYLLNPILEIR